ncbi:MAG: MFS transporter [Rickettsia endosymbiont of Labidopullus appendiculatus]|nr:MFS transporter [Rickettsia endosymbiont of Labidopullus appendiculatus]
MRKITVKFNKLQDIENLKKIMKNVYASNSDHLPDIAKFHLGGKIFIPSQVDKAELHIITNNGTEIITFSKSALSFYLGTQHPFTKVTINSEDEGNYIVLPWNLDSRVGRDNLKNLINRIPSNIRELKYIIYVNSQDNLSSFSLESSIGRKATVIITTFMMSSACIVMANLPTYEQIGIVATWIMIICRAVQGISSMGEIVGAELYLTEMLHPPIQYVSVGLINAFATLGTLSALEIASLVTSDIFNWRVAFWIGATVALIGSVARTKLRETPEFADAKRRIRKIFEKTNTDINLLQDNPIWQEKVNKKTVIAFFLLQCAAPVCFYFVYIYCGNILKNNFGYTLSEVIYHNSIVCLIELLTILTLCYVSLKLYPLLIIKITLLIFSIFMIFCPYLLNNLNAPYQLFFIQFVIVLWQRCLSPATPICLKSFPIFKRFTYASTTFAISRAMIYVISSFGFVYLIEYFGNWGILIIMIPTIIGFAYGLFHFDNLAKTTKNYPHKKLHNLKPVG